MKKGLGTLCGFAATVAFALYNGALGVVYASPWHGSICAYVCERVFCRHFPIL